MPKHFLATAVDALAVIVRKGREVRPLG